MALKHLISMIITTPSLVWWRVKFLRVELGCELMKEQNRHQHAKEYNTDSSTCPYRPSDSLKRAENA
ncbi:unnamed protein product [Dovyalis caffra]|uniref:Uncharacterized protein n=1 Tax=Dovyalis caffra TaxID=77055 RepID=A0AAV1RW51_9ROSI|nr:unnamed protein product [Dovyalis caffra]